MKFCARVLWSNREDGIVDRHSSTIDLLEDRSQRHLWAENIEKC